MIKNYIGVLLFLWLPVLAWAQVPTQKISLSVGYLGAYAIHPGAKVGVNIPLKEWQLKRAKKNQLMSFFVQPELAIYTHINYSTGYLANATTGLTFQGENSKLQTTVSASLGYLAQLDVVTTTVNLQGEVVNRTMRKADYFMPTINGQVGYAIAPVLGAYAGLSLGAKISPEREGALVALFELGMRFSLFNHQNNK